MSTVVKSDHWSIFGRVIPRGELAIFLSTMLRSIFKLSDEAAGLKVNLLTGWRVGKDSGGGSTRKKIYVRSADTGKIWWISTRSLQFRGE